MRSPRERADSLIGDMEAIPITGAEIYYDKSFLNSEEAASLLRTLLAKCAWERRRTTFKYGCLATKRITAILERTTPIRNPSTSLFHGFPSCWF